MIRTTNFITAKNILFGDSLGRTGTLTQIQNDILTDFESSPSYESVTINSISRKVQIVTITNNSTKENFKKILSKPLETFEVGDIVVWGDLTFLITDIDEDQQVQTKGEIQLCNNTLSFYSTTDSTLYSIPCIIGNQVKLGTNETKYITTVTNELYLTVSNTSTTRQIKPDDIFSIGLSSYQIKTICDDVSVPGLLVYKIVYSEEEQVLPVFSVEILNGSSITTGVGTNIQLNYVVKNGTEILSPTPSLVFISSNTNICTVSSLGLVTPIINGSTTITVKLASDLTILDTIVVTVSTTQNNYTYSPLSSTSTPDSEIKLNQTKTYTVQKYNNGAVITQGFTFSVSGDTSAYTLTTVDSNNCTIKCLKSGYTVVLSAVDSSDVTKVITKSIVLKSLF